MQELSLLKAWAKDQTKIPIMQMNSMDRTVLTLDTMG